METHWEELVFEKVSFTTKEIPPVTQEVRQSQEEIQEGTESLQGEHRIYNAESWRAQRQSIK